MQLRTSNNKLQVPQRRARLVLLVFLVLLGSGITSGLAQIKPQKRITSVQVGDTREGSRVTILGDAALNDYEAFRRGDNFYVRIPQSAFAAKYPNYSANGFDDISVQSNADSVLITFKLQPGVVARVDQRQNRLDVFFLSTNTVNHSAPASSATSNSIPGIVMLPTARTRQTRSSDAAGFMPPDSPSANRPRLVTPEDRGTSAQLTQRGQIQLTSSRGTTARPSVQPSVTTTASKNNAALTTEPVKTQPQTELASASSPSTSYTSATPAPTYSRPPLTSRTVSASTGWKRWRDVSVQWVGANRLAAAVVAGVLLGLIALGCFLVVRSRRNSLPRKKQKAPGVQPKYYPSQESEPLHVVDVRNAAGARQSNEELDGVTSMPSQSPAGFAMHPPVSGNGSRKWAGRVVEPDAAESSAFSLETFEVDMPSSGLSIPIYAMRNEETEREVFEL